MRQPPFRARQRRQENRAVRAAEIEGRVILLPAQRADNVPVPPPGRALRRQWKRPGAVHAGGQSQQLRPTKADKV